MLLLLLSRAGCGEVCRGLAVCGGLLAALASHFAHFCCRCCFYLQAVVESAEDWPSVVGFLLRRRALSPTAPLAAEPKALLLQVGC